MSLVLSPSKGEGLPARSLLGSEFGVASTRACRYQGPRALGQGLEGMQACAIGRVDRLSPPPFTRDLPAPHGRRSQGVQRQAALCPRPSCHPQARLRRLGLWGSHPGLPVHSAPLHRPSSSSTSSVPRHALGSDLALGLGMKPKKHLDDRCAYRQALPRPTALDNVPPGLFPRLLQACYCWTSRTDRHPFTPGPQAGHRRTVATPPSCPGFLPETRLRGPW